MIKPEDLRSKRILISPLNWGMGHVSRCIGLIRQLLNQSNAVFIACDTEQELIFREYFDDVTFIPHAGYPFHFGGKGHFGWDLLSRSNSLRKRLNLERDEVTKIVRDHKIDVVVSDHRYGFESPDVPSIFMTHQLNLPVKWYEKGVGVLHQRLMKRFEQIWILDDEQSSLAGKLSENCPENGCYIGHYSRFSIYPGEFEQNGERVLIASGPEIYAIELIESVLREQNVQGLSVIHSTSIQIPKGILEIKGSWKEKDAIIRSASTILSRSGYSTLMDCVYLKANGIFVPTKGQAEQEYLADLWSSR